MKHKELKNDYLIIGNDLETSETLYVTSFCIKSKERIFKLQR